MMNFSVDEHLLQDVMTQLYDNRSVRRTLRRRDRYSRRSSSPSSSSRCVSFADHDEFYTFDSTVPPVQDRELHNFLQDNFPPLPFPADKEESSDCISVVSDQAVSYEAVAEQQDTTPRNSSVDNNDLHSDATDLDISNEDLFNPNTFSSTLTSIHQSNNFYNRRSQPICLPNYELGQEAQHHDMKYESTSRAAQLAVSLVGIYDAVFLKRSNGKWTYAILSEKVLPVENNDQCKLTFVVDPKGSTKTLTYDKWGKCIRMVRDPGQIYSDMSRYMY